MEIMKKVRIYSDKFGKVVSVEEAPEVLAEIKADKEAERKEAASILKDMDEASVKEDRAAARAAKKAEEKAEAPVGDKAEALVEDKSIKPAAKKAPAKKAPAKKAKGN